MELWKFGCLLWRYRTRFDISRKPYLLQGGILILRLRQRKAAIMSEPVCRRSLVSLEIHLSLWCWISQFPGKESNATAARTRHIKLLFDWIIEAQYSSSSISPMSRIFGDLVPRRLSLAATAPQIPAPRGPTWDTWSFKVSVSHLEIQFTLFTYPPHDSIAILTFHHGRLDVSDCIGCAS